MVQIILYYVNKQDRKIYIRHGDRSERATAVEQNNLLLKGINKTFVDELIYNFLGTQGSELFDSEEKINVDAFKYEFKFQYVSTDTIKPFK